MKISPAVKPSGLSCVKVNYVLLGQIKRSSHIRLDTPDASLTRITASKGKILCWKLLVNY